MTPGFRDTLFARLFVLLWVALVASHTLGHATIDWLGWLPGPGSFGGRPPPPPDERPATPPRFDQGPRPFDDRPPRAFDHRPPRSLDDRPAPTLDDRPRPSFGERSPPAIDDRPPPAREGRPPPRGRPPVPWTVMLLDLAIRALVITFAAWLGARWLVAPIRRFGSAAEALGRSLDAPPIDDARGPAEVRQAARVFNAMRDRLREQFAERGRFFAAISHDLRTPLTRIRLRLENFPRDGNVTRCEQDVAEMDAMIDTVLSYLREEGDTEAKQSLDVFSLAEALVDDLVELGRPASISGEPAVITAQPMAMRRCLSNLIDNALRYGGRTDVSVHRDGQAVVVQVDDHGPGIPPEQRAQMLKPFVRLDPSRNRGTGGVGLGLHIAREVAVRNGGTLTLGERPGGGLRVTLRFG